MRASLQTFCVMACVVLCGVALALLGLDLAGFPPLGVAATWTHAAMLSPIGWGLSLKEATPLLFCGLATMVAFRAGAYSIGVNGQFLLGAIAYVGCGTTMSGPPLLIMLLAFLLALLSGAAWAGIAGVLEGWRGVPLVLSTILLNFVALFLVSWLVEVPFHDQHTSAPQTPVLPVGLQLPRFGGDLHLGIALAGLLAVALWLVQSRTVLGFDLTLVGANPQAARLAGVRVGRVRTLALLLSGAIAGLGGAVQQAGVTHYMSDASVGYGFIGIAVALFGRLHPLGVAVAALFFGMLDTGARGLERRLGIPHDLGDLLSGAVLLMVLVAFALQWHARSRPQAEPG